MREVKAFFGFGFFELGFTKTALLCFLARMTRISRVFVFFVVSLRIQASELLRANNPPEGEKGKGQWSGVRGQGSGVSCQGKTVVGGQGSGVGSQGSGSEDGSYPG